MSSSTSDGLPDDPDELVHLGIGAAIAVTATQPSGADNGMALALASRTQIPVLDAWRRVPGDRPIWIIERSDGGGGFRSSAPPDNEPVGPPFVIHDPVPATRVLLAVETRLAAVAGVVDPVIAGHISNASSTCSPGFTDRWLRSVFAETFDGLPQPAASSARLVEQAMSDFGEFATTGFAASVAMLAAAVSEALDHGPLAAGMLGMLQSRARHEGEPFDVGTAVWSMMAYVARRSGFDALETTIDQCLRSGDANKEAALGSETYLEFGLRLRTAALGYAAAGIGSMAMLDADDGSIVTDRFRRTATVADERVATVGTAIGRWALGYDGSEFRADQARVSALREQQGDRAAERYAERLIERMWFHPRAARDSLLAGARGEPSN